MLEFLKHLFRLQFLLIVAAVLTGVYYNQLINWITNKTGDPASESLAVSYENSQELSSGEQLFTRDELAKFNGENGTPIYLAIIGTVFDVSKGIKHYGPGCSYNFFAGRDASVSFINGEFESYDVGKADDVISLKSNDLLSLENWQQFYRKEYKYKGKLIGRFYDEKGEPTHYHWKYLALLEQAKTAKAQAEQLREVYPDCNIEWSEERGTRVWCTKSSGGKQREWVGYPRKLFEVGANNFRCACIQEKDLDTTDVMLKQYDDCGLRAYECYYKVD
ncbi:PREDICTED: neuferricin homolog [Rhagoletis zephyria]|uniref:neuferricin homolog n=1 Tax=Rhagoletis zephyria TaxID=28612 RepID=UPI0008118ABA|nr:PREDICTED: neuferricin homolog [Rhagoletis zephyria]